MAPMRARQDCVSILNESKATVVCHQTRIADSFLSRLIGLLGKAKLSPGAGLLIQPSSGVHTCWMTFPIDIVALGCGYDVVGTWKNVGPWRIRGLSRKTRCVLELPPGEIERAMIMVGDVLRLVAATSEG